MSNLSNKITVLGGGPAGLGAGYFLKLANQPFQIYEAAAQVGGNCITLSRGDYKFDSGAHRLHDKDPEVTALIKEIMGNDLVLIHAPSAIYSNGAYFDFPLSPLNLILNLGIKDTFRASLAWGLSCFSRRSDEHENFQGRVIHKYGHFLAKKFLLNYSEKLWGLPADQLSTGISGGRLKGLNLSTFLLEGLFGKKKKTTHLDGSFYYPKHGYGTITEKLAASCGNAQILTDSKVTQLFHHQGSIQAIEINHQDRYKVDRVINTLPLPLVLKIMSPPPPDEILLEAQKLQFRDVMLVGILIDKSSISSFATLYFPDSEYPFTRIYEPRNRSPLMSPEGKTSLIAEIPCKQSEYREEKPLEDLKQQVAQMLIDIDMLSEDDVIETFCWRLPYAYPMLKAGIEEPIEKITEYLEQFDNLLLSGRNGRFKYAHLHDMLKWGKQAAQEASKLKD